MEKARKANKRIYSVKGYSDHINMWEKLVNIEKLEKCPSSKPLLANNRCEYTICVADRVFRIKKNPYYIKEKVRRKHTAKEMQMQ